MPNISKTIIQLQDALPKLGREKMENFNEDCKSLKDIIDFEFKTADDYVNNMDIKEKMQQRFEQLEQKLEAIENVYQIMKNIPVPVSTEDKNSLKNLKSQLKQLGQKVEEKIIAHKDILSRWLKFFCRLYKIFAIFYFHIYIYFIRFLIGLLKLWWTNKLY